MGIVTKLLGQKAQSAATTADSGVLDGAIDTLESVLRATGEFSFPVPDEDPRFHDLCKDYARHVANGAPILDEGINAELSGARNWAMVRQFFLNRRQQEVDFVTTRTQQYQELVQGMVTALAGISTGESDTQTEVQDHLNSVSKAAASGDLAAVKRSLDNAMAATAKAFDSQRQRFDATLNTTQANLVNLRDDFATGRDQMTRDPLTGTLNAASFETALDQALTLNFILQQPIAVVAIRIEQFPSISASVGKAAAEETLQSVADCLMRCFVRRTDSVATMAPGLFAVLLNDADEGTAESLAARVTGMIHDTVRIPYASQDTEIRCSTARTMLLHGDSPHSVVERVLADLPNTSGSAAVST